MRPKKNKKRCFTRIKTKKSDECTEKYNQNEVSNLPFAVGDEVLACWQDGLYYLAFIKTVIYLHFLSFYCAYYYVKIVLCVSII